MSGPVDERASKVKELLDFDWKLLVRYQPHPSIRLRPRRDREVSTDPAINRVSRLTFPDPTPRSLAPLVREQYALSSDKVDGVEKPLVRLQLALDNGDGTKEDLLYELSDRDLDELLGSLQAVLDEWRKR